MSIQQALETFPSLDPDLWHHCLHVQMSANATPSFSGFCVKEKGHKPQIRFIKTFRSTEKPESSAEKLQQIPAENTGWKSSLVTITRQRSFPGRRIVLHSSCFLCFLPYHAVLVVFAYKIQDEIDYWTKPVWLFLHSVNLLPQRYKIIQGRKEAYQSCKCGGKHHQKELDVYTQFYQVFQKRQIISISPHLKHYILSKWHEMRMFCLETITKSTEVITSIFSTHFFPAFHYIICIYKYNHPSG